MGRMKQLAFLTSLFLLCGCAFNVNYTYKNKYMASKIDARQCPAFGISIIGVGIVGLHDIVRNDIQKYCDTPLDIERVSSLAINPDSTKELLFKNHQDVDVSRIQYLFVIKQHDSKTNRDYSKVTRAEEYDKDGKTKTRDVDYEIYTTTFSVKCEIKLYEIESRELIAESHEIFLTEKSHEKTDSFPNYTLFGQVESIFDFIKSLSSMNNEPTIELSKYPDINYIDAYELQGYFLSYLKKLEST